MPRKSLEEEKETLEGMFTAEFRKEFQVYLKTRHPIFYVTSRDEPSFLTFFARYCIVNGYEGRIWDCGEGLVDIHMERDIALTEADCKSPHSVVEHIISTAKTFMNKRERVQEKRAQGCNGLIFVIKDGADYFSDPHFVRLLKNQAYMNSIVTLIILGSTERYTPSMAGLMPYLTVPSPSKEDYEKCLEEVSSGVESMLPDFKKELADKKEDLLKMFEGLTVYEAAFILSCSIVDKRTIDLDVIQRHIDNTKRVERCQTSV